MKRKAFISGPIQGVETEQSYRDVIREICVHCGYEPVNPWQREKVIYKGTEPDWWMRIPMVDFIKRDLEDIEKCDVLIAYLPRLSTVIAVGLLILSELNCKRFFLNILGRNLEIKQWNM